MISQFRIDIYVKYNINMTKINAISISIGFNISIYQFTIAYLKTLGFCRWKLSNSVPIILYKKRDPSS